MTIRQIRAVNLLRLYVPTLVELSTNLLPRLMVAEQEADKQWLCNLLHARTGRLDIANKVSVCGHTAGDIKKSVKEVAALKEHAAAQCKDFCQENNMYLWPADFWSPQSSSLVPCFGLDRPLFGVQDAPHARHGCRCPPRPPLRITGGKVKGLYSKVVCLPRWRSGPLLPRPRGAMGVQLLPEQYIQIWPCLMQIPANHTLGYGIWTKE